MLSLGFNIDVKDLIPSSMKNAILRGYTNKKYQEFSRAIWLETTNKVMRMNNHIDPRSIDLVCSSPAFNRLYNKLFYSLVPISTLDIAINAAFEMRYLNIPIEPRHTAQLAITIREDIILEIKNNNILLQVMKKNGITNIDKHISPLNEDDSNTLIETLSDLNKLLESYFLSYSANINVGDKLRIYYPYTNDSHRHYTDILINSFKKFELGFFRTGFDYELIDNKGYLRFASISKDNRFEEAEFSTVTIGKISDDKMIWVI